MMKPQEMLKPCPFCGSKDLSITLSVLCNQCGARAAKVFWNTRLAGMRETKALEIANAVAFVARMRVRSARRPSDRSKALGAEEAALQIVKEIAALSAQADAP